MRDLRLGTFDVLVGINLLREGLDLPEVSLVTILDADKEGFLRSERSLIQTIGRAARNSEGRVIMYGDKITDSMKIAIAGDTSVGGRSRKPTTRSMASRRQTIRKRIHEVIEATKSAEPKSDYLSGVSGKMNEERASGS